MKTAAQFTVQFFNRGRGEWNYSLSDGTFGVGETDLLMDAVIKDTGLSKRDILKSLKDSRGQIEISQKLFKSMKSWAGRYASTTKMANSRRVAELYIKKANLSKAKRELMQYRRKGIPAGIMYNTTTQDYEVVEEEYWGDYMMGVRHGEFDIIENIKVGSLLKEGLSAKHEKALEAANISFKGKKAPKYDDLSAKLKKELDGASKEGVDAWLEATYIMTE